jgi:hypothetical protein
MFDLSGVRQVRIDVAVVRNLIGLKDAPELILDPRIRVDQNGSPKSVVVLCDPAKEVTGVEIGPWKRVSPKRRLW